jgi:alkaline phosphatase D
VNTFHPLFLPLQILADTHGYEAWSQIPLEVTRLRRLIGSTSANGVLLLSGDRHVAGFYTALPAVSLNPYPLHEVTASSLTHSSPFTSDVNEPARREQGEGGVAERTGDLMHLNNFGTIEIDWEERRVTVGLVVADECAIPGEWRPMGSMILGAGRVRWG